MISAFGRLCRDESGQSLVEYALVLTLIAVACFAGVRLLGGSTRNLYSNIATSTSTIGN